MADEKKPEEKKVETSVETPVETPVEKADAAPAEKPVEKSDAPKERPAGDTRTRGGRGYANSGGGGDQRGGGGRGRGGDQRGGGGGRGRGRGRRDDRQQDEFDSKIVDLARVTRVMAGGKRMSFRAAVLVGDKKGRVGMGVKKGADVQLAVQKATDYAKKHLITVPIVEGTVPHEMEVKFKGARVLLKPAKEGSGIIAGGPVRIVMEMAGIRSIVSKIKGSGNKISNVSAVLKALSVMRTKESIEQRRES